MISIKISTLQEFFTVTEYSPDTNSFHTLCVFYFSYFQSRSIQYILPPPPPLNVFPMQYSPQNAFPISHFQWARIFFRLTGIEKVYWHPHPD